ncbi:MAG: hypothetical protein IKJ51_06790 [Clostridia bacterium]|nr:hypothetical protein [Clostridia bacterium]
MRKFIALIVLLIFLSVQSFAEEIIDVFDIPWESNINEVITVLENRGFVVPENRIFLDCNSCPYWTYDMKKFSADSFDNVGIRINLFGDNVKDAQIAGYPISLFSANFYYPITDGIVNKTTDCAKYYIAEITLRIDKSMLISIRNDLTNKLSTLYGVYQESSIKDSNLTFLCRAWTGANNTEVCLFSCEDSIDGFSNTIILRYGLNNSKEILQEISNAVKNGSISRESNYNGL